MLKILCELVLEGSNIHCKGSIHLLSLMLHLKKKKEKQILAGKQSLRLV